MTAFVLLVGVASGKDRTGASSTRAAWRIKCVESGAKEHEARREINPGPHSFGKEVAARGDACDWKQ